MTADQSVIDPTIADLRAHLAAAERTIEALRGALSPLVEWWETRYYRVGGTETRACVICMSTGGHATNCPVAIARALLAEGETR